MSKVNEQVIDNFVENLIKEKGLPDLDPAIMDQMKADLKERVSNRVNAAIIAKMPPDQLDVFEKKMDAGDEQDLENYIAAQIPDLENVLAQELLEFRVTYLHP